MSGYQFLHMETYPLEVPKLRQRLEEARRQQGLVVERKLTMRDVCLEAARVPGNHPHVAHPRPYVLLFGMPPEDIPAAIEKMIKEKNQRILEHNRSSPVGTPTVRPIRRDTPIILTVVASHPVLMESDGSGRPSMENPEHSRQVDQWAKCCALWMRDDAASRGATLITVVAHLDETHYHLHGFEIADNLRMDARAAHPGFSAMRAVEPLPGEATKDTRARAKTAYVSAMQRWQDDHHQKVGAPHGLLRVGPRLRRLSRRAYKEEKKAGDGLARIRSAEESERNSVQAAAEQRTREAASAEARLTELLREVAVLEQRASDLEAKVNEAEGRRKKSQDEANALIDKATSFVLAASERERRYAGAAAAEEERLRELNELRKSVQTMLDGERRAVGAVQAETLEAVSAHHAAIVALEEVEERGRSAEERLRRLLEAASIAAADAKAQEAKRECLRGEVAALAAAAEEQSRAIAAADLALAEARRAQDGRDQAMGLREEAVLAAERRQREREIELEAKLAGLDAYLDGRIIVQDGLIGGAKFSIPSGDKCLLKKITPAVEWLKARLLPLHKARSLALARTEAAMAWARGALTGVDREHLTATGEPRLLGDPSCLSAEAKQAIRAHREAVAEFIEQLPDLNELRQVFRLAVEVREGLSQPMRAKADEVGNAIQNLEIFQAAQRQQGQLAR